MTSLTIAQRRADFEAMLKRANLARASISKCRSKAGEEGGKHLAVLAENVAELCSGWVTTAYQARTRPSYRPGDQVKTRALTVAARCLQTIIELDCVQGIPLDDLLAARVDDAEKLFGAHSDEWLDLGINPRLRVQYLLGCLGEVADCWPIAPAHPPLFHPNPDDWQLTALTHLLFEAICAALAAERGLWQAES